MFNRLGQTVRALKRELRVYKRIAADPRTPGVSRWLLIGAVMYAVSPIDLIPDFIPVLGQLDDVIVLPILVGLALWLVPRAVIDDARSHVGRD